MLVLLAFCAVLHVGTSQTTTQPSMTQGPCNPNQWSAWTSCSDTSCKAGTESRTRTLNTADVGNPNCGELSQTRCVSGDCGGSTYMTSSNGNFLLSVPPGGSMTFIEGTDTWTFSDLANQARTYTDTQTTAVSNSAQNLALAAQTNAEAYTDTSVAAVKAAQTAYTNTQTSAAIATANAYTNTQISQFQTSIIATQSAATAQALSGLAANTTTQIAQLQNTVNLQIANSNTAQAAALDSQSTTLTNNINSVNTFANGIKVNLTTAQASINYLNTAVAAAQATANTAQSNNIALNNTVAPQIANLQATVINQANSIANLTSTVISQASTITALNTMFGNLAYYTYRANSQLQCHLTGYAFSLLLKVCVPNQQFTWIRGFPDTRITPDTWTDLPGRSGTTFVKGSPNTLLQITFNDVIGIYSNGIQSWGCQWLFYVDNAQYNSPLSSYTDLAVGWRITPWTSQFYIAGLATGLHTMRFLVYRPYAPSCASCLLGWSNAQVENTITVREILPNNVTFNQNFPDIRSTNTLWADISNRQFAFTKQSNVTDLWVYYEDDLGYYMNGDGPAIGWRLVTNNVPSLENDGYAIPTSGWYIMPMTLFYFLPNIPAGTVSFSLQNIMYAASTQTLQGWPQQANNAFVIEERARGNTAYVTGMNQQYIATGTWTSVPGRSVTHTKLNSTTTIRVTYFDTIGFYGIAHAPACLFSLIVDEGTSSVTSGGTQWFWSHCSTGGGWRQNPQRQSYFPNVGVGTHTYRIQASLSSGASTCSFGYPNGAANNYLVVEEIEQTIL